MQKIKKHHYGFISSQNETGQAESDTKKKVIIPIRSNPPGKGNSKTIAKKCKKLRNIIMISFHAKTGRDRLRVIPKKKSYHSDPFQSDPE